MKKLAIASLLAAVAMFIWGFVFWATGLSNPFNHLSAEASQAVVDGLKASITESGAYQLPDYYVVDQDEFVSRHKEGPIVTIFYQAAGADPQAPVKMLQGFLHYLVTAVVLAFVLKTVAPGLAGYGDRLKLMVVIGLAATIYGNLGNPIWFHHDWGYHLSVALYDFVVYVIAGAVLAYFITGEAEGAEA